MMHRNVDNGKEGEWCREMHVELVGLRGIGHLQSYSLHACAGMHVVPAPSPERLDPGFLNI